jgi:hypothetical protein
MFTYCVGKDWNVVKRQTTLTSDTWVSACRVTVCSVFCVTVFCVLFHCVLCSVSLCSVPLCSVFCSTVFCVLFHCVMLQSVKRMCVILSDKRNSWSKSSQVAAAGREHANCSYGEPWNQYRAYYPLWWVVSSYILKTLTQPYWRAWRLLPGALWSPGREKPPVTLAHENVVMI